MGTATTTPSQSTSLPTPVAVEPGAGRSPTELCLLGGPYVLQGNRRLTIPEGSKRLLVFVALYRDCVDRRHAAGTLWPDGDDERAAGNLRSALWRLKGTGIEVVQADKRSLWLDPAARLDIRRIESWAWRVIDDQVAMDDLRLPSSCRDAAELLPGWYDDWVIFERERLRQEILHALECLSRKLVAMRCFARAIEVALEAVRMEPLRETAQRVLLEAHMAEGNLVEARRLHREYVAHVHRDLGVAPDPSLAALVGLQRSG